MKKDFDYKDINLVPKKGIVSSRSECDTSREFGKYTFKLPVVPANMESVISRELAEELAREGYFYIMHRFTEHPLNFIEYMKEQKLITSISIGVNEDDYKLLDNMVSLNLIPDYITVDIAHGHCIKMEKMLNHIQNRKEFDECFIIAGNISTHDAMKDLVKWGADAVKVGIAPGEVCTTAMATGFGSRGIQASTVWNIAAKGCPVPVIADGGIREHGDIAKALTMGADMVMIGGMLAGFEDSPGEVVIHNDDWFNEKEHGTVGLKYKEYWGSASSCQSGKKNRIEGTSKIIKMKYESILDELTRMGESLQSSISYGGGKNIDVFLRTEYIVK